MTGKVQKRKAALRAKLIDLAEERIAKNGLAALRARDLAADAGCAVGAIYSHFDDLNALVLIVNGRTFERLGVAVRAVSNDGALPKDRLLAMSLAYLYFAAENRGLWRALFDVQMTEGAVPDWYDEALGGLFGEIAGPVSALYPDLAADAAELMTRTLFSSVHGIVTLGLESRFGEVTLTRIETMVQLLISEIGKK